MPDVATLNVVFDILVASLPLANLWILKRIVNLLFQESNPSIGYPVIGTYIVIYVAIMILIQLIGILNSLCREDLREKVAFHTEAALLQKINSLKDLAYFEIPEFYDKLRGARSTGRATAFALLPIIPWT